MEKTTHVAKFCPDKKKFKCELCGGSHPTILCGLPKFLSQQREKANEKRKAAGEKRTEMPTTKKTVEGNSAEGKQNLNDA